jgi:hypothetical protein
MLQYLKYRFSALLVIVMLQSCATYYDKSKHTESAILAGDYSKAKKSIKSNKFLNKKRNTLLFHLEMGKVTHLHGEFDTSNYHFNLADNMMEEMNILGDFAVSTLVNPSLQRYRASDFERIIIHYYKALNYINLGLIEEAVVEARQLNLKEQSLFIDKKGNDKKYAQDPFGLILMGMIYEADFDYNNAFIAYRNAFEYFESSKIYKLQTPTTLANDVNRTAKLSGINYQIKEQKNPSTKGEGGELILFWENGLAPIKKEKNLFFAMAKGSKESLFIFTDLDGTISVPITYNFGNNEEDFNPSDLGILRVAYSYYVSRNQFNHQAKLKVNGLNYLFNLGQDIDGLAFQVEKENFVKELIKLIIRVVVKKLAEIKLTEQNQVAGLALGITNAAMEKSDTRNWQSLPNQINYARVPLKKGQNKVELILENGKVITVNVIGNGKMVFKNLVTN